MARSTYIYVVETPQGYPVACFTVKREMISFIRQFSAYGQITEYGVRRFHDGRSDQTVRLGTVREVLADAEKP